MGSISVNNKGFSIKGIKFTGTVNITYLAIGAGLLGAAKIGHDWYKTWKNTPEKREDARFNRWKREQEYTKNHSNDNTTATKADSPSDSCDTDTRKRACGVPMSDVINGKGEDNTQTLLGHTYLVEGTRNVIYGKQKCGKSSHCIDLALSIATGIDFGLNFDLKGEISKPIHVAYIDGEMRRNDYVHRYGKKGISFDNITWYERGRYNSDQEFLDDIREIVMNYGKDIVLIVDNGTKVQGNPTGNATNDFDSGLKQIQKEAKEMGFSFTFVLIMHSKQGKDGVVGSSNVVNFYENIYKLENTDNDCRSLVFQSCRSYQDGRAYQLRRDANGISFRYDTSDVNDDVHEETCPLVDSWKDLSPEQVKEVLDFHKPNVAGHGYKAIYKKFGERYGFKNEMNVRKFFELHSPGQSA